MDRLSDGDRDLMHRRYAEAMEVQAIAAAMNRSPNAVSKSLAHPPALIGLHQQRRQRPAAARRRTMIDCPDRWQELDSVLDRVLDGIYDDVDLRRLNAILRADAAACRRYIHYVELHGRLAWGDGVFFLYMVRRLNCRVRTAATKKQGATTRSPIRPSHLARSPNALRSNRRLPVLLRGSGRDRGLGLLVGWMYQVSVSQHPIAQESRRG